MSVGARAGLVMALQASCFAVPLFAAAGTLHWPAAWAFLALTFGPALVMTRALAVRDPELLEERFKVPVQDGQPLWDRTVLFGMLLLTMGWLSLIGLDVVRFRWLRLPFEAQLGGGVGVLGAMYLRARVFRENGFLAPVVKLQTDRGHSVISTGPYAVIRHPLYASVLIFFPSVALILGSAWGLLTTPLLVAGVVVRTALEDRELSRKLVGYVAYAQRVRYRLVPLLW